MVIRSQGLFAVVTGLRHVLQSAQKGPTVGDFEKDGGGSAVRSRSLVRGVCVMMAVGSLESRHGASCWFVKEGRLAQIVDDEPSLV